MDSVIARVAEGDGWLLELAERESRSVAELGALRQAPIDEPGGRRALCEFGGLWVALVPREL